MPEAMFAEFLVDLIAALPEMVDKINQVAVNFRDKHPQLSAPPPAAERSGIDAQIDAKLAALH